MQLLTDLGLTFSRVMVWTLIAWLLGILFGLMAYKSRVINGIMLPINNLFRHISPFCWLPIVIIISGIGELSVGLILLMAMLFNSILMTQEALNGIPRDLLEHAYLDGAHGWGLIWEIELPLIWRNLIDIFRVLWSVGFSTVIAAEMLGVKSGLGYRLLDFRYLLRYQEMFFYILIIGIIGILMDYILIFLRRFFSV